MSVQVTGKVTTGQYAMRSHSPLVCILLFSKKVSRFEQARDTRLLKHSVLHGLVHCYQPLLSYLSCNLNQSFRKGRDKSVCFQNRRFHQLRHYMRLTSANSPSAVSLICSACIRWALTFSRSLDILDRSVLVYNTQLLLTQQDASELAFVRVSMLLQAGAAVSSGLHTPICSMI